MSRRPTLREVSGRFGLLAIYLFGSRAEDGIRILHGEPLPRASSSDLDVGLLFAGDEAPPEALAELQVVFEDLFAPCRVDLVPVRAVDPLFQFRIIDGDRIFALDARAADRYELEVMRSASELLPWQRQNELERYGISTS